MLGPLQNAHELDLQEARPRPQQVAGGRLAVGPFREVDLGRGAGGVADHQRPVAAVAGEVGEVGLAPARGHLDAALAQPFPELQVAVLAQRSHRGQQEGQPRRAGGRVFDDQEPGVLGFGQVVPALRQRLAFEVVLVVVERHVTVVDRQRRQRGVEQKAALDRADLGRRVAFEDARLERPREEGVVDAVDHVGDRRALAENRLVERLAGVAALDEAQLDAGLLLEAGDDVLGEREARVREHRERFREGQTEDQGNEDEQLLQHKTPPCHAGGGRMGRLPVTFPTPALPGSGSKGVSQPVGHPR